MSKNKVIDLEEYKYFNSSKFKSDELLEEALDATSKNKALKLAKQALEIYPDNIDAENLIVEFEENPIKKLKKYDSIIEKATKLLEEQNMFDKENIGDFWLILETRPYMRARHNKTITLLELGRYSEAIKECEKLYKKFNDTSAFMLFTMAIMYFKKGDYKKAKQYLRKTEEQNEFILDFLLNENGEFLKGCMSDYYSCGSEEEAFFVIHDLMYLLGSVPSFMAFVEKEYRNKI